MSRIVIATMAAAAAIFSLAPRAAAQNVTSDFAYSLVPNGPAAEDVLDSVAGQTERWYWFLPISGRSYCAETQVGGHQDVSTTNDGIDTVLRIFRGNGITLIGSPNDDEDEPQGGTLSRRCWVADEGGTVSSASGVREYVKVTSFQIENAGTAKFNFRVHIAETSMFSNWFYTGGDYSAYTIVRNTTSSNVDYQIRWRNAAGTQVGTSSGTLGPNGSTFIDARTVGGIGAGKSGTVEIAHNGSPGGIMATTTVLSASTGLSFDTIFTTRPTW